jgi:hypothetical protein
MAINDNYSFQSFKRQSFVDVDAAAFNNSEIVGSSFYQEAPHRDDSGSARGTGHRSPMVDVFPPDMTGVTFIRCTLDNVTIPAGNTIGERCTHRKLRVMNDGDDWVLDDVTNKPVEPMSVEMYEKYGVSIDPADIPATQRRGRSELQAARDAREATR